MADAGRRGLVLVDTSAWIAFFRPRGDAAIKQRLRALLDDDRVATAGPIALELLQGCRSDPERASLARELRAVHWLSVDDDHWFRAGDIAAALRRTGVTVGAIDTLIATLAEAHGCALLHRDRDFESLARHARLRLLDT